VILQRKLEIKIQKKTKAASSLSELKKELGIATKGRKK